MRIKQWTSVWTKCIYWNHRHIQHPIVLSYVWHMWFPEYLFNSIWRKIHFEDERNDFKYLNHLFLCFNIWIDFLQNQPYFPGKLYWHLWKTIKFWDSPGPFAQITASRHPTAACSGALGMQNRWCTMQTWKQPQPLRHNWGYWRAQTAN